MSINTGLLYYRFVIHSTASVMSNLSQSQNSELQPRGWGALKQHVIEHKVEVALWATRVFTIIFTFGYFIPLIG
jgi:hypothetical protein